MTSSKPFFKSSVRSERVASSKSNDSFLDGKFDPESMPSKVQEAEIDDGVEDMMPMGYPDMPERKEYLWSCDLEGSI